MLDLFQRLSRHSRGVVEKVHGKAVTIFPTVRALGVNAPRTIAAGTAYETVACFFENTLAENDATSRPLTGNGRMLNSDPAVMASITLIDGKPLQTGFILRREEDGAIFEIGQFKPDGLGGVYAPLALMQALPEIV
jgi:hypothetical protein